VLLRTIDTHWVEHLTAMEELREGIYLRGYGQQDPLVAYKREAHGFYDEMQARIASGVAQTILRVTVRTAEQAEQSEQVQTQTGPGGTTGRPTPGTGNGRPAAPPANAKLGRNDPCWCGSGKKFKKCHGR
jgi:preprotein translocase subunit SecA